MPPLLIVASSWVFPHVPPMCVNMDLSSNSVSKESTFLLAIQSHFVFERSMTSFCSGVGFAAVLIVSVGGCCDCCASRDCAIIVNRNRPVIRAKVFMALSSRRVLILFPLHPRIYG